IGMDRIGEYEHGLLEYGARLLQDIDGLKIVGVAGEKASILSFVCEVIHPHDIVTLLDQDGIACRGGHHCAQPTMQRYRIPATTRASVSFYNKYEELDALAASIKKAIRLFS
ncbi:MAG: aminotransferase class V-fold PLP-dependent enzyme, partial [Nitrospinaceae bacterium]